MPFLGGDALLWDFLCLGWYIASRVEHTPRDVRVVRMVFDNGLSFVGVVSLVVMTARWVGGVGFWNLLSWLGGFWVVELLPICGLFGPPCFVVGSCFLSGGWRFLFGGY